jgi:hypothetical protein
MPPPLRRSRLATQPAGLDWPAWLAIIERKRRLLLRANGRTLIPGAYFALATLSSFKLEGIEVTEHDVLQALSRNRAQRKLRSRTAQRIRNHVALLHGIESAIAIGQPLKASAVLRWYTSISSGLSTTGLGEDRMRRLEQITRRINSPQLRLQAALQDMARAHCELLGDPLFPGFNGILSRLLLRYRLGRCSLPFVVFDGRAPAAASETDLTLRLLRGIDDSFNLLLSH